MDKNLRNNVRDYLECHFFCYKDSLIKDEHTSSSTFDSVPHNMSAKAFEKEFIDIVEVCKIVWPSLYGYFMHYQSLKGKQGAKANDASSFFYLFWNHFYRHSRQHERQTKNTLLVFRCVLASLSEGLSVRRSVRPSVRPSVRRLVGNAFFFKSQKWWFFLMYVIREA